MKIIVLNGKYGKGKFCTVDDEDFEFLSKFKWTCNKGGYAVASVFCAGKLRPTLMHRLLMGCFPNDGNIVDHENHNTLDNRRENLRIATHAQNLYNRIKKSNKTSKFLGVVKGRDKFVAQIGFQGKLHYLGRFDTDYEAALAYDRAAEKLFGEFANLNLPEIKREPIHTSKRYLKLGSKFRGVKKRGNKFESRIVHNKQFYFLGSYDSEKEAALAFDRKSYELRGNKGFLNFPCNFYATDLTHTNVLCNN